MIAIEESILMGKDVNSPRKFLKTLSNTYRRSNRERNIILECIVVSIVVISLVIIFLIYQKYQADILKNQYQDGKTISTIIEEGTDTTKRQLQQLSYVNNIGEENEIGKLLEGQYAYSQCVALDEIAYNKMVKPTFIHLCGKYPEQANEIMLSKKTLNYLGITNPKIGMQITLNFYWNDIFTTKMTGKQDFFLSGYYENYDNKLSDTSIAYISKERVKQAGISQYPCRLLVDIKDWGANGSQVENKLKRDLNLSDTQRIVCYDSAQYRAIEGTMGNYLIAYMFVLAMFFCLFIAIYNVIYISLGSNINQYGILRTIGATNRQIKKMIYIQTREIYLKSCIWGVGLSISIQYFILKPVVKNLYMENYRAIPRFDLFYLGSYIVVLLLTAITLFGSTSLAIHKSNMISPIEAVKYEDTTNTYSVGSKLQKIVNIKKVGIIFRMALYNILRYRKKLIFTSIFLALGCEIGLLGIVITTGANQMNKLQKNPDFTIDMPIDTVTYLIENEKDVVTLIADHNVSDIKKLLGSYVEDINIVQGFLPIIKNVAETDSLKIVEHDSLPVIQMLDDKNLNNLQKFTDKYNIAIDWETFNEKNGVLILHENLIPQTYQKIESQYIGEKIELYDLVPVGTEMQNMPIETLTNCGYINILHSDCPALSLPWQGNHKAYLIVSEKTFETLKSNFMVRNMKIEINVNANEEPICKQKLKAWIQEENFKFQADDSRNKNQLLYTLRCNSDEIAKESLYIKTSQAIMYTVSGILIFAGLINYFSVTFTNLVTRQREFSIMRSVGMTKRMLRKMLIYEGLIYVGLIMGLLLFVGNTFMAIVVYILYQNIDYFIFKYPFNIFLCIISIMALLCVIIPSVLIRKFEHKKLIDRIK